MHTYTHSCIDTYRHTHKHMRVRMHACIHTYIHTHAHTHACAYTHTHTHTHVSTNSHTHTQTYRHVCMHGYTCTHTQTQMEALCRLMTSGKETGQYFLTKYPNLTGLTWRSCRMQMKLGVCKLDNTLWQNTKDGGPSSLDDFRKKYLKRVQNTRGVLSGLSA